MFKKFNSKSEVREIFSDLYSPVSIYLTIREKFSNSILLEASDYIPDENCYSFIGINAISNFRLDKDNVTIKFPDGSSYNESCEKSKAVEILENYYSSFDVEIDLEDRSIANGLFGYLSYDAIENFDTIKLKNISGDEIPEIYYNVYEFIIAVNHHKKQMYVVKNNFEGTASNLEIDDILKLINEPVTEKTSFKAISEYSSNMNEETHLDMIAKCKDHIQKGDIFQVVPSRSFTQEYEGDDFQVYRALRKINPSPYLFYFDFGDFRLFGSSPEADLLIEDGRAYLHPIAGTCPRTGDESKDNASVEVLLSDPKENAEHVMLVDLARNDLNKNCSQVQVDSYREVQKFSHVIHLVSIVSGKVFDGVSAFRLLADTFPMGTLSGAPKFRAMEIIDSYEPDRRQFYGGAIGYVHFNGDCVHAIMIRSFLSRDNKLIRRAGGGVVIESVPEKEVEEVKNKLMALKKAIELAEEL